MNKQRSLNVKIGGKCGDTILSCPALSSLAQESGYKVHLWLTTNKQSNHPLALDKWSVADAKFIKPLLECQPYIKDVTVVHDIPDWLKVDADLDLAPQYLPVKDGYIAKHYLWLTGQWYDLAKPWLFLDECIPNDYIVVCRSERYRNPFVDYAILKDEKCVFVGHEKEHEQFVRKFGINPPRFICKDALELAQLMYGARLVIGNQSLPFAIAEGLKCPRLLEVYPKCPNVFTTSRDFITQIGFQKMLEIALKQNIRAFGKH